jgi:hypothetical protein
MTEQARAGHGTTASGLPFQISKLLVFCTIAATAATSALIIAILVDMPSGTAPSPGPNGQPPPPPDLQPAAVFPIITGLFVLAWLAVLVVAVRDQILSRLREIHDPELDRERFAGMLVDLRTELRAELADDRDRELKALEERLADYGEHRETDGYLSGMRVATEQPGEAKVRSIRRPPSSR